MDNTGYYGYSSRQPPPQVYTVDRERDRYRKSKRQYSESEGSSVLDRSRERFSVDDPPDGGYWAWLVVLACGILHLCNELVYWMFYNTIVIAQFRNPAMILKGGVAKDTYTELMVFEDVRLTGEIIAAIASVFIGYRVVAVFGSLCVLGGFLGAAFVIPSENIELMGFLVGFLGGLGCSFWRFTAYVAIMEYFKRYRLMAIIMSGFGRVVGIFIGVGILAEPFKKIRDTTADLNELETMTEWKTYYICQVVMAVIAAIAACFIRPLSLTKYSRRYYDCSGLFKLGNTAMCRGGMLLLLLCIYFLYYLGDTIPSTTLIYWMVIEDFSTTHILAALFTLACGVTFGYVLLAFWPVRKKLYSTLIWMGILAMLIGMLTLQMPVFTKPYLPHVVAYTAILGTSQVLFESILRFVIPIGFGRQYIRWIEGLLGLFAGCATIANNFIIKELNDEGPGYLENSFYFSGSAFLSAGVLAVVVVNFIICCNFKDRNLERDYVREPELVEQVVEVIEPQPQPLRVSRYDRPPIRASRRDDDPKYYTTAYDYR